MYVSAYDKNGNLFDVATSLIIEWSTDQQNVGHFHDQLTRHEKRRYNEKLIQNGTSSCMYNVFINNTSAECLGFISQICSVEKCF